MNRNNIFENGKICCRILFCIFLAKMIEKLACKVYKNFFYLIVQKIVTRLNYYLKGEKEEKIFNTDFFYINFES